MRTIAETIELLERNNTKIEVMLPTGPGADDYQLVDVMRLVRSMAALLEANSET